MTRRAPATALDIAGECRPGGHWLAGRGVRDLSGARPSRRTPVPSN
jgi:hypothetical protein